MKYAIGLIELDASRGNVFELQVKDPGRVLHGMVIHKPRPLVVLRRPGPEENDALSVPVLIIQFDPEAQPRRRRFVAIGPGVVVDDADPACGLGLEYCLTLVNPNNGVPFVLYEAMLPSEVIPDDSARPKPVNGEIEVLG